LRQHHKQNQEGDREKDSENKNNKIKKSKVIIYDTMETILTTVEDNILDSLTFQLGSSSNYIQERKSVSFYASGSNIYIYIYIHRRELHY
jgi:hypothetical protein